MVGDEQFEPLFKHGETMMSVNFDQIFSPIPNIMLAVQSIMDKSEHEIKVTAVDENSTSMKRQLKWQSFIEGANKPMFEYIRQVQGIGIKEPVAPKSVEEMELMDKIGSFKLAYEMSMKDAITLTENLSKIKKIKRRVIYDLVSNGKAAVWCHNDIGGVTKNTYIDFADLIIEDCDDEDYSDASYGSLLLWMTIMDVRAESGLSEDELLKIARKWSKKKEGVMYGVERRDGGIWYDDVRIPVFMSFYKSLDVQYKTYLTDGTGRVYNEPWRIDRRIGQDGKTYINKFVPPKMYTKENAENRVTEREGQRVLYMSKWIADSNFIFGCKKVEDLPFDFFAKDVKLPFMLYRLPGKPMVESMIPIADDIQLTHLHLQNDRAMAPPDGLKIEISSITNIKIGKKTLHPLGVLKVYSNTGKLLYRVAPLENGQPIGIQNPVERIEGGYNNAVMAAANSLQLAFNELNRISGIADIAVGGNPKSEQGLGVTRVALDTTDQTLGPIYTGWITIKENCAQYSALKIHSSILGAEGINSPYYEMLGPQKFNAIKGVGPFPPVYWGFNIIAVVDAEMKAKVEDAAKAALGLGKDGVPILSYAEYLFVLSKLQENCNLDDIRAYMAYKETKAREANDKKANDAQLLAGKMAEEKDAKQAQAELAKEKALSDLKIKEDTEMTLNKARLLVVDYALQQELEDHKINAQANIDAGQVPGINGSPQQPNNQPPKVQQNNMPSPAQQT
jgi:hypothetical protein